MIVHDLDAAGARLSVRPIEANAPLPVDPDGIPPFAIARERFEPVAWQSSQCFERRSRIEDRQAPRGLRLKTLGGFDERSISKPLGLLVPIAQDHLAVRVRLLTVDVKRQFGSLQLAGPDLDGGPKRSTPRREAGRSAGAGAFRSGLDLDQAFKLGPGYGALNEGASDDE